MRHLGQQGVATCGESYLLTHETTLDVMQCDCTKCLFNVFGQMLHQADVVANRLREVVDSRQPRVVNVQGKD